MVAPSSCPAKTALEVQYTKGIIKVGVFNQELYYDSTKNKFKDGGASAYLQSVTADPESTYLSPMSQTITNQMNSDVRTVTVDEVKNMQTAYKNDMDNIGYEYAEYLKNYKCALSAFLGSFSGGQMSTADKTDYLNAAINLNKRLNALFEIMNLLTNRYMAYAGQKINLNKQVNDEIASRNATLQNEYQVLNGDNAAILNQSAMIRFTEEKNNYVTNQISLWAALNIMALGAIFYVYRQM